MSNNNGFTKESAIQYLREQGLTPGQIIEACKPKFNPKTLKDYTQEEVNKKFKLFLTMAEQHYSATIDKNIPYDFEDAPRYVFENVIDLLGEGIWGELRKYK